MLNVPLKCPYQVPSSEEYSPEGTMVTNTFAYLGKWLKWFTFILV